MGNEVGAERFTHKLTPDWSGHRNRTDLLSVFRLLIVIGLLSSVSALAQTQTNRAGIQSQNNTNFYNCGTHCITGPILNGVIGNMNASYGVMDDANIWTGSNIFSGPVTFTVAPTFLPTSIAVADLLPAGTLGYCLIVAAGPSVGYQACAAGGGNVSASGTPTAAQLAVWVSASAIQGDTINATILSAVAGAPTGSGSVVLGTSPTIGGLTVTGSFTALGLVTNADLANAATTVNGQTCPLGSTCTVTVAIGSGVTGLGANVATALGDALGATGGIVSVSGTPTNGHCASWGAGGILGDAGGACTTGGGGGTVASGTVGGLAIYTGSGTSTVVGSTPTGANVATALATAIDVSPGLTIMDGAITTGHCLQWGPGIQDATTACGTATLTPGTTVTSGGAAGQVMYDTGSKLQESANFVYSAGILSLGVSGTLGGVAMGNATSGTLTLEPTTGALGTITEYLPIASGDTLVSLAATQTLTNKSIAGSEINSSLVALAYGGTNANLSATPGATVYSTGSGLAISAAGTSGYVWTSNGSSAPTWQPVTPTIAFPQTVSGATSGGVIYADSTTDIKSSAALAANAIVIGGGAGAAPFTTSTAAGVVTAFSHAINGASGLVTQDGAITTDDCLQWGPGAQDANGICATLGGNNTFTGTNTFGEVIGSGRTVVGTTDTLAATDCGKEITYSSASSVTVTIPATLPQWCNISIAEIGAGIVSVNGSAVAAATLHSAHSYTGTSGQWAIIGINIEANSGGSAAIAILTGDGA